MPLINPVRSAFGLQWKRCIDENGHCNAFQLFMQTAIRYSEAPHSRIDFLLQSCRVKLFCTSSPRVNSNGSGFLFIQCVMAYKQQSDVTICVFISWVEKRRIQKTSGKSIFRLFSLKKSLAFHCSEKLIITTLRAWLKFWCHQVHTHTHLDAHSCNHSSRPTDYKQNVFTQAFSFEVA